MSFTSRALVALVLALPAAAAHAQPSTLPIQGFLTGSDGDPVDGIHAISLALYDAEEGGEDVFREAHGEVMVNEGVLIVYLGTGDPQPIAGGATPSFDLTLFRQHSELWLQVVIDSVEEITPRTPLGTVPYAAHAHSAGSVDWGNLQSMPSDIADGDQGFTTEGELTSLLNDNYVSASGGTATNLTTTGVTTTGLIRVPTVQDVAVANDNGSLTIGATSQNIGIDNNEIMSRASGAPSTLHLQAEGGRVRIGSGANLAVLQLDVDGTVQTSGTDSTPEVYRLTEVSCARGEMFVGRASEQSTQDSLCVCLQVDSTTSYWCFNP